MPRQGAVTLADLIAPTLTLVCARRERRGVYGVARLMAERCDARPSFLSKDCPRRAGRASQIEEGLRVDGGDGSAGDKNVARLAAPQLRDDVGSARTRLKAR